MNKSDIQAMLKSKNVPQWELAKEIGTSETTLVRWLRDDPIREDRAKRITEALERMERGE